MSFTSVFRASALVVLLFASASAQAFSDVLPPLISTLRERSLTLSNATDKVARKQKSAVDAAVRTLSRSTNSLAAEITGLSKVIRPLTRAFPEEFSVGGGGSVSLALSAALLNVQSQIVADMDGLQTLIDALPAGPTRERIVAALASVQGMLANANTDDLAAWIKALVTANKNQVKNATALKRALFGNQNLVSATVTLNGEIESWRTANAGATWDRRGSTNTLILGGNQGTNSSVAIVLDDYNGATGTFTLTSGDFLDWRTGAYYFFDSGTVTISAVNISARTISGMFSFTASGWMGSVTVSNGLFNLRNFTVQQ